MQLCAFCTFKYFFFLFSCPHSNFFFFLFLPFIIFFPSVYFFFFFQYFSLVFLCLVIPRSPFGHSAIYVKIHFYRSFRFVTIFKLCAWRTEKKLKWRKNDKKERKKNHHCTHHRPNRTPPMCPGLLKNYTIRFFNWKSPTIYHTLRMYVCTHKK